MTRNEFIQSLRSHECIELPFPPYAKRFRSESTVPGIRRIYFTCFESEFFATFLFTEGIRARIQGSYADYRLADNGLPCPAASPSDAPSEDANA